LQTCVVRPDQGRLVKQGRGRRRLSGLRTGGCGCREFYAGRARRGAAGGVARDLGAPAECRYLAADLAAFRGPGHPDLAGPALRAGRRPADRRRPPGHLAGLGRQRARRRLSIGAGICAWRQRPALPGPPMPAANPNAPYPATRARSMCGLHGVCERRMLGQNTVIWALCSKQDSRRERQGSRLAGRAALSASGAAPGYRRLGAGGWRRLLVAQEDAVLGPGTV